MFSIPRILRIGTLALFMSSSALAARELPVPLTSKALTDFIREERIGSIEELLPRLPKEYRANFILMKQSRSLHEASPDEPRALLFDRKARFVLSFNGSPRQRNGEKLEVMEFDEKSEQFIFQEIVIGQGGAVGTSGDNPRTCEHCHTGRNQPVWDGYKIWPGAYGAVGGALQGLKDAEEFMRFRKAMSSHPRFKYLMGLDETGGNLAGRLDAGERLLGFTQNIQALYLRKIVRDILDHPEFEKAKFAIWAAANRCGDMAEFLPHSLVDRMAIDPSAWRKLVRQRINARYEFTLKRLDNSNPGNPFTTNERNDPRENFDLQNDSPQRVADLSYVLEAVLGIEAKRFGKGLEEYNFDFSSPLQGSQELFEAIEARIAPRIPENLRTCSAAKVHSRNLLKDYTPSCVNPNVVNGKHDILVEMARGIDELLSYCASCHESDAAKAGALPYIPYRNPAQLKEALAKKAHTSDQRLIDEAMGRLSDDAGSRQMPLGGGMTPEERRRVSDYLRTLQKPKKRH